MSVVWIVTGFVAAFIGYHFVRGFIDALGIRRRPKFRVVRFDKETE